MTATREQRRRKREREKAAKTGEKCLLKSWHCAGLIG